MPAFVCGVAENHRVRATPPIFGVVNTALLVHTACMATSDAGGIGAYDRAVVRLERIVATIGDRSPTMLNGRQLEVLTGLLDLAASTLIDAIVDLGLDPV